MKSLADWAGIPIAWNDRGIDLIFGDRLAVKEIKARKRGQLRPVLPDDDACAPADAIQYWMYNGISLPEHADTFSRLGIQYELTLLYPTHLGNECSKTLGHIHTFPPKGTLSYAEVCEVVWGEALFVFQTLNVERKAAPFCYAVYAQQGDKVVFPPNLHHLTINAGNEPLLFSDLICVDAKGNYDGLSAMQGAAYRYETGITCAWVRNPTYLEAAPLKVYAALPFPEMGLTPDVPLYALVERLTADRLAWLVQPERFAAAFPNVAEMVAPALETPTHG